MAMSSLPCAGWFGPAGAPSSSIQPPAPQSPVAPACPLDGLLDSFVPSVLENPILKPFSRGLSALFPGRESRPSIAWGAKLDEAQKDSVLRVARAINASPDDLMNVIAVETGGTFDPSIRANGQKNGAVGLIQFTDTAIEALNERRPEGAPALTKASLAKMSFSAQLEGPVLDYFRWHLRNVPSPNAGDLYTAVLAPAAVGKPDDHTVYSQGSDAYKANASIDSNKDGQITRGEVTARLSLWAQRGPENAG